MVTTKMQRGGRETLLPAELLRRRALTPSERDFQVYEAVVIGGASTRHAADEFGISQTRIVQIRKLVAEWIGKSVPANAELTPFQRLRVAADIAERRADWLYSQAMEGWRGSQKPQATICRGRMSGEVHTLRDRHGDPRYLLAAMRISERQVHLSGTICKVLTERGNANKVGRASDGSIRDEQQAENGDAEPEVHNEGIQFDGEAADSPIEDCSRARADGHSRESVDAAPLAVSACGDERCDELENRRRAFLAALMDDTAPVHPPFTDAGGMLLDSSQPSLAIQTNDGSALLGKPALAPATALDQPAASRKERRKQQRLLARKIRKAK